MGDAGQIVIALVGLAVTVGVITMIVRDPQGANTVILAGADAVAGATRSLEGR